MPKRSIKYQNKYDGNILHMKADSLCYKSWLYSGWRIGILLSWTFLTHGLGSRWTSSYDQWYVYVVSLVCFDFGIHTKSTDRYIYLFCTYICLNRWCRCQSTIQAMHVQCTSVLPEQSKDPGTRASVCIYEC